nr:hypothetical protein [Candidatus Sigynarchaeota archaeon]
MRVAIWLPCFEDQIRNCLEHVIHVVARLGRRFEIHEVQLLDEILGIGAKEFFGNILPDFVTKRIDQN